MTSQPENVCVNNKPHDAHYWEAETVGLAPPIVYRCPGSVEFEEPEYLCFNSSAHEKHTWTNHWVDQVCTCPGVCETELGVIVRGSIPMSPCPNRNPHKNHVHKGRFCVGIPAPTPSLFVGEMKDTPKTITFYESPEGLLYEAEPDDTWAGVMILRDAEGYEIRMDKTDFMMKYKAKTFNRRTDI